MKKVWRGLLVSSILWVGAAALAGWKLNKQIGDDAMAVGVIGTSDGPTSIIVSQDGRLRGVACAFFHSTIFFVNLFSPIKILLKKHHSKRRTARRARRL